MFRKVLVSFFFFALVLLAGCTKEAPVAPDLQNNGKNSELTKQSPTDKATTNDWACPDASIDYLGPQNYRNYVTNSVPYSFVWQIEISEMHYTGEYASEVHVYIDDNLIYDVDVWSGSHYRSEWYSLGYGTHTIKCVVKNHEWIAGITAVSEVQQTNTFYISRPPTPAAPTLGLYHYTNPTLTWGAVANAEEYVIYGNSTNNGYWYEIGRTTETSWVDYNHRCFDGTGPKGVYYYYVVKAINNTYGTSSGYSSTVGTMIDADYIEP